MNANAEKFLLAYRQTLLRAVRKNPSDYALLSTDTPESYAERVAEIMTRKASEGQAVNVSPAMKLAAKWCNLPDTRQATIYAYLRDAS